MSVAQLDAHTGPSYPNKNTPNYYEVFEIDKNGSPKHADQFASTGFVSADARAKSETDPNWNAAHSTTSGKSTQTGTAYFYPKSNIKVWPPSEKIPEANGLPSWKSNPFSAHAPDSNGVDRSATVKWGPPTSLDPYTRAKYAHSETNDRNFAASPGGPDSSGSPASSSQSPQRLPVLQFPAAASQSAFPKHQHPPQHQAATSPSAAAAAHASAAGHPETMTARPDPRRGMSMRAEARAQGQADALAARNAGAASAAAAPTAASSSMHARTARFEARAQLRADAFVARRAAAAPAAAAAADVEMAPADLARAKRPRSPESSKSDAERPRKFPGNSESSGRPATRK